MTQYTYIIKYKEPGREWSQTSYTSPEPVTKEYLIEFFGLEKDCEDYLMSYTGHEDYDSMKPYIALTDKTRKHMMETNF